jgi:hypothetical protein
MGITVPSYEIGLGKILELKHAAMEDRSINAEKHFTGGRGKILVRFEIVEI